MQIEYLLCAKHCAKDFMCIIPFVFIISSSEVGTITKFNPIDEETETQRSLKTCQGHTSSKWWNQNLNSGLFVP